MATLWIQRALFIGAVFLLTSAGVTLASSSAQGNGSVTASLREPPLETEDGDAMAPSLWKDDHELMSSRLYINASRRELEVRGERGAGFWSVKGANYYDSNGNQVWFSGVQWSGMEVSGAPHGLWVRNYNDMMWQMKSLGFNTIRFSFAGQALRKSSFPTNINYDINPDLRGLNSVQVMDKIIEAAGWHKMKIILDYHRKRLTSYPEEGFWFDKKLPESVWLYHWGVLAKRYRKNTAVIGFDLFNEPHNWTTHLDTPVWAPWGVREPYNWRTACIKAINRIQRYNKNAIIFIEGMWWKSWWGGNLREVRKFPITPSIRSKLAYSAHDYGPNVWDQPWFQVKSFPNNLPGYWDRRWGFLVKRKVAPVWLGEWGCFLNPPNNSKNRRERKWVFKLRAYVYRLQISWTWFNWGPDSRDTGGILMDDWWSVRWDKIKLLQPIMHPDFGPAPGNR